MNHLFLNTTVGWLGAGIPDRLPAEIGDWNLQALDIEEPALDVDMVVVETASFEKTRQCEAYCNQFACPVLFVAQPEDLDGIVNGLLAKNDVCLAGSPLNLVAARLAKIQQAQRVMVDPLTGVQRREAFFNFVQRWSMTATEEDPLSLLLIDLDHFKGFNDRFGQAAGDETLQRFAQAVRQLGSQSPLIARLGGQEFGLLLNVEEPLAMDIAEQICEAARNLEVRRDGKTTVSIGVASRKDVKRLDQLHEIADEALFAAKAEGRDRVRGYSQITAESLLSGEDPNLVSLENKSRVLGERVTSFVAQRSRQILQALRAEAESDGLTEFYNRRYLDRRLELQFRHHQESGQPLSIALLDLDHFGLFNKKYGWPTGDRALTTLRDVILANIRAESDWVGRYGGEEFCVVLPGTSLEDALVVCKRLRAATAGTVFDSTAGDPLRLTISVGVVECVPADSCPQDVIERVSQQTLRAKEEGRDRVCWSEPTDLDRLEWAAVGPANIAASESLQAAATVPPLALPSGNVPANSNS
ncbi:Response regulator PleD [Roseimaritima multifibrata]|uniref:diguanylate cyclase n=1 Tax=Roseimaritima multifibrata TaxID=1930274 RepID=A0A517MLM0_9BACT|nr:GGDEF domain-containing protein [Roseimaritima multifibrata]QDS95781.1 Response regulator PleD [Roseimaritima multifibrata]